MLFFLCFRPTIKFQGGSPVDPLFEPPADPPFDSTSQKSFLSSFRRLWLNFPSSPLSGRFRSSAALAIPHRKSFAAIPSVSLVLLGARIATFRCHTNRSVKLPSFRHFQDRVLSTNREKWGQKTGLCFTRFVCLTFHGPFASNGSNPYLNRNRIERYNATLDGQNRQSPIASDFGSRTQIAALFAVLLYQSV